MITKAKIVNGFMVDGKLRNDVWAVFRGMLPSDKINEETMRFEVVTEDFEFLGEWNVELIGIEFDDYNEDLEDEDPYQSFFN